MKPANHIWRDRSGRLWRRIAAHPWRVLLGAGLVSGLAISCATVTRTVMAPPSIPGATYIGSETCGDCHDEMVQRFKSATHARLQAQGENALGAGCESCHGPGSIHSDSAGVLGTIINPGKSPEVCFQCHLDLRGQFNLPHHHPVMEGDINCVDCHDPHQGSAYKGGGTQLAAAHETCLDCHPAQRGPYVFEHEAMWEGCVTCHNPHGSVNAKLLVQRNANLCLKCHAQVQDGSDLRIGGRNHRLLLSVGTCWSGGCHEAVHGSQVNSSLQY